MFNLGIFCFYQGSNINDVYKASQIINKYCNMLKHWETLNAFGDYVLMLEMENHRNLMWNPSGLGELLEIVSCSSWCYAEFWTIAKH